jgi:hypothetical protein
MNNYQEDKLNIYYSVKSTCDKFQQTWGSNTVFSASYQAFVANIPLIELNCDTQIIENKGVTTDKKTKRATMTDKALFIGNRLQSYARVAGNSTLLESIDYRSSEMNRARDIYVIGICDAIVAKANFVVSGLSAYGVTAAMITDLQNAILTYSASLSNPRVNKVQTKMQRRTWSYCSNKMMIY